MEWVCVGGAAVRLRISVVHAIDAAELPCPWALQLSSSLWLGHRGQCAITGAINLAWDIEREGFIRVKGGYRVLCSQGTP